MGSSDSYSVPLIIFSIVYLGFITIMYSSINMTGATEIDLSIDPLGNSHDINLGNFVTNFSQLGLWNILFFSPVLIGLAYILLALLLPNWL